MITVNINSGETVKLALSTSSPYPIEYSWTFVKTGAVTGASAGTGDLIEQELEGEGTVVYTITPTQTATGCTGDSVDTIVIVEPFYNELKTQSFTKNDCDPGLIGSNVIYIVAEKTYKSLISLDDANQKAQDDINENGQAYANANGTCESITEDIAFTKLTTNLREWNGTIWQEPGPKSKPALTPYNTETYNYLKHDVGADSYDFSIYMYVDASDNLGPGSGVYYLPSTGSYPYEFPIKIGQITDPGDYPSSDVPLMGVGRSGYTAVGSISSTDGGIYFVSQSATGFVAMFNDAKPSAPAMSQCIFNFHT